MNGSVAIRSVAVAMLLSVLCAPGGARADQNTEEARRLYESATRHFDLTEYEAALNDFKEGYRRKDDPVFLYNIAQCYRLLNKNDDALKFYRNYLRRAPDAPNRDEVEKRIATLQESIAAAERARQTPPQGTLAPPSVPGTAPSQEPPAQKPGGTSAAAEPAPPAAHADLTASAPPTKTPVYKKWWLWTTVGIVVAAGVGVGVGLALSSPSSRSYPGVTF
jgi:tetratricopeptide (TPR) repeat protein